MLQYARSIYYDSVLVSLGQWFCPGAGELVMT